MNKIIDNIDFTKFVLKNKPMSAKEKEVLMRAVPKMTETEKAEIIGNTRMTQLAAMIGDLRKNLTDPTLTKEEVKKIEAKWSMEKHKKIVSELEEEQIRSARAKLQKKISPPQST